MTIDKTKQRIKDETAGADNIFTSAVELQGKFNLQIDGTWAGTITVQRKFPDAKYTGTHTGADDAGTLTDANQAWTNDELIGMYIVNDTDGSAGIITDNDATTVAVTLADGTPDSDFDTGDAYSIWRDVPSGAFTTNADRVGEEVEQGVFYRAGFREGDDTSGTDNIRFSR